MAHMDDYNSSAHTAAEHNVQMYDSYYQKPDWWFRFRYDTQVKRKTCIYLYKLAANNLRSKRVLEIGFGSGAVLFSFDPTCELYGVEISRSAVEHAKRKAEEKGYKSFDFRTVTDEALPYGDNFFDVVFASHVVEHVENDEKLMAEIFRVLRPSGIAVLLIPINENYDDPNHVHRYTSSRFTELSKKISFKVISCLENELLYHFVEKFYFEQYNYRWKIMGPVIAMLFNFPTSILPFRAYRAIDSVMMKLGWKPRQFGCVLAKQ